MICSAPLILTETSSPRITHWEIALQQHNTVPAVPLILSILLFSSLSAHQLLWKTKQKKRRKSSKTTNAKHAYCLQGAHCCRCWSWLMHAGVVLLTVVMVEPTVFCCFWRWNSSSDCVARISREWKESSVDLCGSMPGIFFKCVCGGVFSGIFVKVFILDFSS